MMCINDTMEPLSRRTSHERQGGRRNVQSGNPPLHNTSQQVTSTGCVLGPNAVPVPLLLRHQYSVSSSQLLYKAPSYSDRFCKWLKQFIQNWIANWKAFTVHAFQFSMNLFNHIKSHYKEKLSIRVDSSVGVLQSISPSACLLPSIKCLH